MGIEVGTALLIAAVLGTATAGVGLSQSAKASKAAKGQKEQAERIRAEELKKSEALIAKADTLADEAAKTASIAAGRKRQRIRGTLATGPRGLLDEPNVAKPKLLGS